MHNELKDKAESIIKIFPTEIGNKYNDILSKSYDWLTNVVVKQQRFLTLDEFWIAYPFKRTGLNKQGLETLINEMKKAINHN